MFAAVKPSPLPQFHKLPAPNTPKSRPTRLDYWYPLLQITSSNKYARFRNRCQLQHTQLVISACAKNVRRSGRGYSVIPGRSQTAQLGCPLHACAPRAAHRRARLFLAWREQSVIATTLSISFAGINKRVLTRSDGAWRCSLPPLPFGSQANGAAARLRCGV